ncbi:peptidase S41 family protein, partial [Vibrio parahaemolyticus V-223/04]
CNLLKWDTCSAARIKIASLVSLFTTIRS